MSKFNSGFALRIDEMLDLREARGYKRGTYLTELLKFDRHCAERYPAQSALTSEIVLSWFNAETELGGNLTRRAAAVRHLGKYLIALGEDAYVLPERVAVSRHSFSPYVFTDSELTALFAAIDELPQDKNEPLLETYPNLPKYGYI